MIKLQDIYYFYPDSTTAVLNDISLEIEPGEFVLVVGESGAGKSTLLRLFNGLVPHFSGGKIQGTAVVNGHDVIHSGPQILSREVGFVHQTPEAQAVLDKVEPEIAFALENAGIPPAEMRLRVEEVLDLLDLTPLRHRTLVTLSGGERQRVAIAAALALRPSILVLDEPTSQLDPQSAADVLKALVRLNEDLGLTIIVAEHRLERVLRYADRLIYVNHGRVAADGHPQEVLNQLPLVPPLIELSQKLNWRPLPLTIKEGQRHARRLIVTRQPPPASPPRSSPPEPLLTIKNVGQQYGDKVALRDVSLSIQAGEIVALLGRNGAGKSTLLRGLVNLHPLVKGEVRLRGESIHGRATADLCRTIGYLPQNPDDLLFAETVREELWATLTNHGLPLDEAWVAELLEELGLTAVVEAYPRDLSVGQRQRVALGAIMVTRPQVLLLDEPTRGLDYGAKRALVGLWQRWQARGMGLLLVTHDVELVAQVAQRVVVLSEGEVIAEGNTAVVLNASPLFAPQIARLFPQQNWLTIQDVLAHI